MKKFFIILFIIFTWIFIPAFSNENTYSQNGIVTAVEYIDTEELSKNNENNIQTKQHCHQLQSVYNPLKIPVLSMYHSKHFPDRQYMYNKQFHLWTIKQQIYYRLF